MESAVIFTEEEETMAFRLLESLQTAHEAAEILLRQIRENDWSKLDEITSLLEQLLAATQTAAAPYREKLGAIVLPLTCQSARGSVRAIHEAGERNADKCKMKLRSELIPILEEAYVSFYYWAYVYGHADREALYEEKTIYELNALRGVNRAVESGRFKYDASFLVLAYNHLDYTQRCVESLLDSIPGGLNYELILWDNGSTDDTVRYFESVHPTKLFESRINWSTGGAAGRSTEGKYVFNISNDTLILPGAIENMLECIQSRDDIAWVVPATPNISNYQTIQTDYHDIETLYAFARRNNVTDPCRWEQRVRLCNPISLINMPLMTSRSGGICYGERFRRDSTFPDDYISLLVRRFGYRSVLAKDAYCYHFGSVTLKDEVQQKNEMKYYNDGRKSFLGEFGVDPWGPGFCYDEPFHERIVGEHDGHVEVLGINCGLGSHSLKIKEQVKEYCRNEDCTLSNITDDERFLPDLKGIGDYTQSVKTIKSLREFLAEKSFDYIVWETGFLPQYKFNTVLKLAVEHLAAGGALLLKRSEQPAAPHPPHMTAREIGDGWTMYRKQVDPTQTKGNGENEE